jgi:hypothetical protein
MSWIFGRWMLLALLVGGAQAQGMLLPTVTLASGDAGGLDTSVGGALRSLASRAAVVFAGQVQTIERKGGVVEVVFRVDQVMQGDVGDTYTLREWGGLWAAGEQRYRVGQRAMMFLHAGSVGGLSSPVDGMEGVVPVVPMGAEVVPLLDVRRLATRVQRVQGAPMRGEAIALNEAVAVVSAWKKGRRVEPQEKRLPVGWKPADTALLQQGGGVDHAAQ